MAVNPMQRKANNSFILGMLITLLITGVIIALLLMQLSKLNTEKKENEAKKVYAFVLATSVQSGEIITSDNLSKVEVNKDTIPANAITSASDLENYSLCDSEGRTIVVQKDSATGENKFTLLISNEERPELKLDEATGNYYYEKKTESGVNKVFITLDSKTVIAKVDMEANTLLTTSVITKGELLTADVRKQEYNIITLPTQLVTGEYVDIRLRLPNGQDFIVVSHKEVTIPTINGVDSESCIWLELSEVEILNMSSAIVEAYRMNGAKLYATRYVEAGSQDAATVTYLPSDEVIALMAKDPNAVQKAKNALFARNNDNSQKTVIRNPINNAKNNDDADDNLQDGVKNEIQGLQDEREKYLESLGM